MHVPQDWRQVSLTPSKAHRSLVFHLATHSHGLFRPSPRLNVLAESVHWFVTQELQVTGQWDSTFSKRQRLSVFNRATHAHDRSAPSTNILRGESTQLLVGPETGVGDGVGASAELVHWSSQVCLHVFLTPSIAHRILLFNLRTHTHFLESPFPRINLLSESVHWFVAHALQVTGQCDSTFSIRQRFSVFLLATHSHDRDLPSTIILRGESTQLPFDTETGARDGLATGALVGPPMHLPQVCLQVSSTPIMAHRSLVFHLATHSHGFIIPLKRANVISESVHWLVSHTLQVTGQCDSTLSRAQRLLSVATHSHDRAIPSTIILTGESTQYTDGLEGARDGVAEGASVGDKVGLLDGKRDGC